MITIGLRYPHNNHDSGYMSNLSMMIALDPYKRLKYTYLWKKLHTIQKYLISYLSLTEALKYLQWMTLHLIVYIYSLCKATLHHFQTIVHRSKLHFTPLVGTFTTMSQRSHLTSSHLSLGHCYHDREECEALKYDYRVEEA